LIIERHLRIPLRHHDALSDAETCARRCEINFNRYFYCYSPPRPLEEIEADIRNIETGIMRMLVEVTGGQAA